MKKNRGSGGIDKVTIAQFEARKAFYLERLHHKLWEGTYQPKPVKRVEIDKSEGGKRKLGIPAMRDRAKQALHFLVLDPIAECLADLNSYGFRQG